MFQRGGEERWVYNNRLSNTSSGHFVTLLKVSRFLIRRWFSREIRCSQTHTCPSVELACWSFCFSVFTAVCLLQEGKEGRNVGNSALAPVHMANLYRLWTWFQIILSNDLHSEKSSTGQSGKIRAAWNEIRWDQTALLLLSCRSLQHAYQSLISNQKVQFQMKNMNWMLA